MKKKKVRYKTNYEKKAKKPVSEEEFQQISHMNAIYDEGHGTNRGITYGRAIVSPRTKFSTCSNR